MLSDNHPDHIHVAFDDHRLVANPGDKMMTLVASALAGGDCIDDADVVERWRYGQRHRLRGQCAIHPGDLPVSVLKNALSGRFSASDDSESSDAPYRRHSSYLCPLWRFLRKIGWVFSSSIACPMYPTSATLV